MNSPLELHPGTLLANPMLFNISHALPELILAVGALFLLLFGAVRGKESDGPVTEIAVGVLGLAIVVIALDTHFDVDPRVVVFDGAFIDDTFGRFMKVLTLLGSIVTLLMGQSFLAREKIDKFEYPILVILSTLGALILISATGLITLYLGLELMSLALYVLAAFHRDNQRASEAGLKYFVLGALSSGMLLYGASLLYGFAGTVEFTGIARPHRRGGRRAKHRPAVRPRVPDGGPCLQDVGRALPHVDAGRLPGRADAGDGVLRHRAEDGRCRHHHARHHHGVPRYHAAVAAARRLHLDPVDGAGLVRGDRPDQHQAADGLFGDRPHGLRPRRDSPPARRRASRASPSTWRSTSP